MDIKKIAVLILTIALVGAIFPKNMGYVSDFANIIDYKAEGIIRKYATELDQKTGAQLAVVTVPTLYELAIEDYAWQLFEKWGIGKKGEDSGVLLLIAPQQRKVRIEVGYGFEGAIPDGLAGEIIREKVLPFFKQGDMNNGIIAGSMELLRLMAIEKGVELSGDLNVRVEGKQPPSALKIIFNLIFIFLIFGGRWFFFPMFFGTSRGYYSSGGGGFGGFGGFGGGLSGGGGASGSW